MVFVMEQEWFEMNDIRRRSLSKLVWIPLREVNTISNDIKYAFDGYKEEFRGLGSIAVPNEKREYAEKLEWSDVGIKSHSGVFFNQKYTPSDIYDYYCDNFIGLNLVLEQFFNDGYPAEWHLHQDFVITLNLRREKDIWICPSDGYAEVARIKKSPAGNPILLEVKSEYLKDYLCARNMSLYITSFFSRDTVLTDASFINWKNGRKEELTSTDTWEGRVIEIHEGGGEEFGTEMAILHISRTDVDESDDIPDISSIPTDDNIVSNSIKRGFSGRKLFRVIGELWRNEWIDSGSVSIRIRRDKITPTVFFIIDADGNKKSGEQFINSGKWLWFKADVIMALINKRGGFLRWYTRNTGSVSCSYGNGVHFGINSLNLINVYAKDIGLLPEWQQQIWAGYNISPDGGVSQELLDSQVKVEPARTQAPEEFLIKGIKLLNDISEEKLGIMLIKEHDIMPELLKKIHRFRAIDEPSLFALAKDIARITADSLNKEEIQRLAPLPDGKNLGSIKSLENLLSTKIPNDEARKITAALVGIYELRLADAHLPSSKIGDAFNLIQIDRNLPTISQAYQLLCACVSSIYNIAKVIEQWK